MKNIINKTLLVGLGLFLLSSCEKQDDPFYEGPSALQFRSESGKKTVQKDQGFSETTIDYGTQTAVVGTHQVKLTYVASESTAVPGVDFQVVNDTKELAAGQSVGQFDIKILELGATSVQKVAVFTVSSPTLPLAQFNQKYTLVMSLKCPVEPFLVGPFVYPAGFWNTPGPGPAFLIEKAAGSNKLLVKEFLDVGIDLEITYDTDEEVFTVVDKYTGSNTTFQGASREIWVRQKAASTANVVDICSKSIYLDTQYYLKGTTAAYNGDTSETFTGN